MTRHKWQVLRSSYPWTRKCALCGCINKEGEPRPDRRPGFERHMITPMTYSTDGGQTWTEGDPPACTGGKEGWS